ncbi:MAG: aldo/keto reductase [Paenibacillaceae bacterium]|nr:aldo/keto reductase [Paenibacillaceae bacterium]
MQTSLIPGTPLRPSVICLGAGGFGSNIAEADAFRLMDQFADGGGNFLNTANVYGDWVPGTKSLSEKAIGRWLRSRGNRDRTIVATKGAHPDLAAMHIPRVTRRDIVHDLEQSLAHLQTDYIDLYWLHRDDPNQPVEAIMDTLHEQIERGTIRAIGCSNWTLTRMEEANRYAASRGLMPFAASQKMWSLARPNEDNRSDPTMLVMRDEDVLYHRRTGIAAIPYSSQANGFFSGRYGRDVVPAKASVGSLYYNEDNFARLERTAVIAKRLSVAQTEVALGYLLSQPFPVFPIIGSRTPLQLEESMRAGDLRLEPAVVRYLETGE